MRRIGRAGLTKEILLPLPIETVRALSLGNHRAFSTARVGQGERSPILAPNGNSLSVTMEPKL
jgi:hypothetical protein